MLTVDFADQDVSVSESDSVLGYSAEDSSNWLLDSSTDLISLLNWTEKCTLEQGRISHNFATLVITPF